MNFWPAPSTTRRSFTRGAAIRIGPTRSARPGPRRSVADHQGVAGLVPVAAEPRQVFLDLHAQSGFDHALRPQPGRPSNVAPTDVLRSPSSSALVISFNIGGVPFSPARTGALGLTSTTSPEGYVAFSLHPQLSVIAPEPWFFPQKAR